MTRRKDGKNAGLVTSCVHFFGILFSIAFAIWGFYNYFGIQIAGHTHTAASPNGPKPIADNAQCYGYRLYELNFIIPIMECIGVFLGGLAACSGILDAFCHFLSTKSPIEDEEDEHYAVLRESWVQSPSAILLSDDEQQQTDNNAEINGSLNTDPLLREESVSYHQTYKHKKKKSSSDGLLGCCMDERNICGYTMFRNCATFLKALNGAGIFIACVLSAYYLFESNCVNEFPVIYELTEPYLIAQFAYMMISFSCCCLLTCGPLLTNIVVLILSR
ncbi:hypothetical protein ABK040_011061 [Willaertia magna]